MRYHKVKSKFNTGQLQTINWIDNPVLVAAGPGSGKCIKGDTYITHDGGMRQIKDSEKVNNVISINLDKHRTNLKKCNWFDMGIEKTITIKTQTGIELTGTPEHPLLTWDGDFTWKKLEELTNEDYVLLYPGHGLYCKPIYTNIEPGESYLLGLLIGDGYTSRTKYTIILSNNNDNIIKKYYDLVNYYWGGYISSIKQKNTNGIDHTIHNQRIYSRLYELDYPLSKIAKDKYIPRWIFESTLDNKVAFLQGYFDADGSVTDKNIEIITASKQLAIQTQQLLLSLGIVSIKKPKKVKHYEHNDYFRLTISGEYSRKFENVIGFKFEKNKKQKLKKLNDKVCNPNIGCYPHTKKLILDLKDEWISQSRWIGKKTQLCQDNEIKTVSHYIRGTRNPSKEKIKYLIKYCECESSKKLKFLTRFYPDKIVDIQQTESEHVYDLNVPTTHNFIANGIVSHNTTSVVERISNLINEGVKQENIFATTFTKKAAEEMNKRLEAKGIDTKQMAVQTFHSFCYHIVRGIYRPHDNFMDWKIDEGEKYKNIIKTVTGYNGMKWHNCDITEVENFISLCKNELLRQPRCRNLPSLSPTYKKYMFDIERLNEAYFRCEEMREQRRILTFDDMLIDAYEILNDYTSCREKIQNKFKYVIIDEAQDSNRAQIELTRIIAAPQNNLMLVGDQNQSLYSFRGSKPGYLLKFVEEYNASTISMNVNYRCCSKIVDMSTRCIQHNSNNENVKFIANKKKEGIIRYRHLDNTDLEADYVADNIMKLHSYDVPYQEMYVLYRTNAQSRALEEVFTDAKIPYVIHGAVSFYKRKEIKNLISYIKLLDEPKDENVGRTALMTPFRFIRKDYINEIEEVCCGKDIPYHLAVFEVAQRRRVPSAIHFVELFQSLQNIVNSGEYTVGQLLSKIVTETQYIEHLKRSEGSDTAENSRVSNIGELIRSSDRYKSIGEFLKFINKKKKKSLEKKSVQCMSIHKSKGLEAQVVFLIGCNENILPHHKSMLPEQLEEERRLFYVAATRAIDVLFISSIDTLGMQTTSSLLPSRFLSESKILKSEVGTFEMKGQRGLFDEDSY